MEIIEKYPNKPWNWYRISSNKFKYNKELILKYIGKCRKIYKKYKRLNRIKILKTYICRDLLSTILNYDSF